MSAKTKSKKDLRRICSKCGKKRFIKNMVEVGTTHGSYFQSGREFEVYKCKPNALDPEKCR